MSFFNNATVAAFGGAFFAFLLVALTDWRRRHRHKTLISTLVANFNELAEKKRASVTMNLELLQIDGKITAAPFMPFPKGVLQNYHLQILDQLPPEASQCLFALDFWMSAIDGLLQDATAVAQKIEELSDSDPTSSAKDLYLKNYRDSLENARKNLGHLILMCDHYVKKDYDKILGFSHSVD